MGMDLISRKGGASWNLGAWRSLLELAEQYGWVPAGTGPPRGRRKAEWRGKVRMATYMSNDGARFYARDARALANALERALPDISNKPLPRGQKPKTTLQFFAGWARPELKEFIEFCREGSFRIH